MKINILFNFIYVKDIVICIKFLFLDLSESSI